MIKLVKKYIVYTIVIGVIYLIMPIFFQGEKYVYDYIEYQFVFPATALLSGVLFCRKNGLDFTFPLIPPIIFIGSVLIYSHYYHWHIYTFIYLILAMLGCFVGDMLYKANIEGHRKSEIPQNDEESYKIKITNISVHSVDEQEEK